MINKITYGIGGYDESKPNNNIIESIEIDEGLGLTDPTVVLNVLLDALAVATTIEEVQAAAAAAQAAQ